MSKYLSVLLLGSLLFTSCKQVAKMYLAANRDLEFDSRADYNKYILRKYKINSHQLYYPAHGKAYEVYTDPSIEKSAGYYRTFIDSNQVYSYSPFLAEMPSCLGRILGDIRSDTLPIEENDLFLKYEILNINNNERYIPVSNKKTIVYFLSTQMGNWNKNIFKKIRKELNDTVNFNYVYITYDDVAYLK